MDFMDFETFSFLHTNTFSCILFALEKVEEVVETGAETVVTARQQCVRTMNTYMRKSKIPLKILDIVQLVHMVMKENRNATA